MNLDISCIIEFKILNQHLLIKVKTKRFDMEMELLNNEAPVERNGN